MAIQLRAGTVEIVLLFGPPLWDIQVLMGVAIDGN